MAHRENRCGGTIKEGTIVGVNLCAPDGVGFTVVRGLPALVPAVVMERTDRSRPWGVREGDHVPKLFEILGLQV